MATRIEPTTEQLQAAWLVRRKRSWPPTLAETMAVPLYAALVRMAAVQRVLAERRNASQAAAVQALPAPTRPTTPATPAAPQAATKRPSSPWPPRRPAADAFDRKRAAAGDRDDD